MKFFANFLKYLTPFLEYTVEWYVCFLAADIWRQSLTNMNIIHRVSKTVFLKNSLINTMSGRILIIISQWLLRSYAIRGEAPSQSNIGRSRLYPVTLGSHNWSNVALESSNESILPSNGNAMGGYNFTSILCFKTLIYRFFDVCVQSQQQIAFYECLIQLRSKFQPIFTFHMDYLWICRNTNTTRSIRINEPRGKDQHFQGLRFLVFGDFWKAKITQD